MKISKFNKKIIELPSCLLCSSFCAFRKRTGTVRTCFFPSIEFVRCGNKLKIKKIVIRIFEMRLFTDSRVLIV
jgi:hypothetical protein